MKILRTSLLVIPFFFAGCITNISDEVIDKQAGQSAAGVSSISIDAEQNSSDLFIQGTTADTLSASARLSLWAKSKEEAQRIARNLNLSWNVVGGEARLTTDYPGQEKEFASIDKFSVLAANRLNLNIDLSTSDITIKDMLGDVNIDASTGDMRVDTKGQLSIKASTSDVIASAGKDVAIDLSTGDIDLNMTSPSFNNVDIDVSTGDVILRILPDVGISFDIETSTGDISVNYDGSSTFTSSGSLTLNVNGGGKRVKITTRTGNVSIRNL